MARNRTGRLVGLLESLFNVPHLATDGKLAVVVRVLCERLGLEIIDPPEVLLGDGVSDAIERSPMTVTNGVARVPIHGSLVEHVPGLQPDSGMVGYNQIASMSDIAQNDPSVRDVLYSINTHGGEGSGAFDLQEYIKSTVTKPKTAVVAPTALSAGYLLACGSDRIFMPQFGQVGSIGAVVMIRDNSKQLEQQGVQYRFIYSGKHKVDGAPGIPLSDEVVSRLQQSVDTMRGEFASRVAAARGVSQKNILNTEALTFSGDEAISLSLVDGVASERQVTATLDAGQRTQVQGFKASEKTPRSATVEHLQAIATQLGIDTSGLDTPELLLSAITKALAAQSASVSAMADGKAFLDEQKVANFQEMRGKLASMVDRAMLNSIEAKATATKAELLLLQGQLAGKLNAADCAEVDPAVEGSLAGWARRSATSSPGVFENDILPILPVKVSTSAVLQGFVSGFGTKGSNAVKDADEGGAGGTAVKSKGIFEVKGKRYCFGPTAIEEGYADEDVPNLREMVAKSDGAADSLIDQGIIAPV